MALLISNAILHTVGNIAAQTHYSDVELEVDSETVIEYVGKQVRRLLRNAAAKNATFTAESPVYRLVKSFQKDEIPFRDMSRRLCERMAGIMDGNDDILPADILTAFFDNGKDTYIAIVKLNYGECFTQYRRTSSDGKTENAIVKNTVVLPLNAGKVEEACLIPYDPMVLRILEKPHTVNGESVNYFSKLFLECETEMSKKEAAEAIQEIADEINAKYYDANVETSARIKSELLAEAERVEEQDGLILEGVVQRAFEGNDEAQKEFIELAKEYGLPHQVALDKPFIQKEFKTQRYRAENGVELKFPSELVHDPDQLQMVTNPDGSISITFRNLRPAEV
jgi:nucleoid-associated protein YejK